MNPTNTAQAAPLKLSDFFLYPLTGIAIAAANAKNSLNRNVEMIDKGSMLLESQVIRT